MPLFEIPKAEHKVLANITLEESTVQLLNHYAAFSNASADQVIEQAILYVCRKDKDFQKYLESNREKTPEASLRVLSKPGRKAAPNQ